MKFQKDFSKYSKSLREFAMRLVFCGVLVLIFAVMHMYIAGNVTYEYTDKQKEIPYENTASMQTGLQLHTLKLEDDKLVIYGPDGAVLSSTEIDGELLTDYDRKLLGEGIRAEKSDISELIEELLS